MTLETKEQLKEESKEYRKGFRDGFSKAIEEVKRIREIHRPLKETIRKLRSRLT